MRLARVVTCLHPKVKKEKKRGDKGPNNGNAKKTRKGPMNGNPTLRQKSAESNNQEH
jgi:hypothetical protein